MAPNLNQHLVLSVFILATLLDVEWYFIVILTCISLMTKDVQHSFM